MATFTQANRPMALTTPLGEDVLLLEKLSGSEALSELFSFQLDLLAEADAKVPFERLLGQSVTVELRPTGLTSRYFNGIVSRFSQGARIRGTDQAATFIRYRAEIVPKFWLLTRIAQSRIFLQLSVPDILKQVLSGLDVSYKIQGHFDPRDHCVQYRESDFAFASRLMEEEGIYYYFTHSAKGHQLVLANTPDGHPDVPGPSPIPYQESSFGLRADERITSWVKTQEIRSGKETLWDAHFELPHDHLEATKTTTERITAGTVAHSLKVGGNDQLELYDYPGGYAPRYDGIDATGSSQTSHLQKIYQDNARTAGIRMQQETLPSLAIEGQSDCRLLTAGHKFTLDMHFNANGNYVLTHVTHTASIEGTYLLEKGATYRYENRFLAIPAALPYRPPQRTPRARIDGTQTALVVGPSGEEIFTDMYGRVKVQYNWDRQGKKDSSSSCWIRVASSWAGAQWGAIHIPRIGQEVIVAFEEGDPDRPVIVGSVYNAKQMPPYTLPENKTQSGLKSRSTLQGDAEHFNELRFEDKKDAEDIYFQAQKDFHRVVKNDDDLKVSGQQTITIQKDRTETIKEGHDSITLEKGNRSLTLKSGNETVALDDGSRTHKIAKDDSLSVGGSQTVKIMSNQAITLSEGSYTLTAETGSIAIKADLGAVTVEGLESIKLQVGANSLVIDQTGITLQGLNIKIEGEVMLEAKALLAKVQAETMLQLQGVLTMIN